MEIVHSNQALEEVPDDFICPISLSVMKSPLMSKDGKNFERKAIIDWLARGNGSCPLTRQPLTPSCLVPNVNLKMNIRRWKRRNGLLDSENDDSSVSSESDSGFVGFVRLDDHEEDGTRLTDIDSSEVQRRVDEELSDLIELYNEVLELTSTALDTMPPPSRRPSPFESHEALSPEERDAAIGVLVAHTARCHWTPAALLKTKAPCS
jgi:hypothetical protein